MFESVKIATSKRTTEQDEMKTVTRYEIREYQFEGAGHSKSMGRKLRERKAATKLVKKLKNMGHKYAFAAPMKITL